MKGDRLSQGQSQAQSTNTSSSALEEKFLNLLCLSERAMNPCNSCNRFAIFNLSSRLRLAARLFKVRFLKFACSARSCSRCVALRAILELFLRASLINSLTRLRCFLSYNLIKCFHLVISFMILQRSDRTWLAPSLFSKSFNRSLFRATNRWNFTFSISDFKTFTPLFSLKPPKIARKFGSTSDKFG